MGICCSKSRQPSLNVPHPAVMPIFGIPIIKPRENETNNIRQKLISCHDDVSDVTDITVVRQLERVEECEVEHDFKEEPIVDEEINEKYENVLEDANVFEEANVLEDANVFEEANVLEDANVFEEANVLEDANVLEETNVLEDANVLEEANDDDKYIYNHINEVKYNNTNENKYNDYANYKSKYNHGTYDIAYDDGESDTRAVDDIPDSLLSSSVKSNHLSEGDNVEANYIGRGKNDDNDAIGNNKSGLNLMAKDINET